MPRVTGPLFSLEAHGRLKDTITYQRRPGGASVVVQPDPRQPRTAAQVAHRDRLAALVASWQAMSEEEKDTWRDLAAARGGRISGYNLFVQEYLAIKEWTLELQPGADDGKDTYINSSSPDTNYGTDTQLLHYRRSRYGFVQFDLTSIPSGAEIVSATFTLFGVGAFSAGDGMRVQRVTQAWTEAGATWNTYDGVNNWASAGGDVGGPEYSTTIAGGEAEWDLTTLVGQWVDGTYDNYGLRSMMSAAYGNWGSAGSSDNATASKRPKLVVVYKYYLVD